MKTTIRKLFIIVIYICIILLNTKVYAATTGKINQETVRMRKEASTDSNIITLISLNEEVEIISEEGEWYKLKYKEYTGYVRKDMISVSGETTETVTTENTNNTTENNDIKEENNENLSNNQEEKNIEKIGFSGKISEKIELKIVPSINSSIIDAIDENSEITIKDIMNKWSYIESENKSGWVLTSKIKIQENKTEEPVKNENVTESKKEEQTEKKEPVKEEQNKTAETTKYVSAETLNMREKSDNDAKIISQLKINTKVTLIEVVDSSWAKIKVNGKTGYVASKYLSDKKVEISSRSEDISRGESQKENIVEESNTKNSTSNTTGTNVVAYAQKYLGSKYVHGGSLPSTGFDCSGFTSYVYKNFGINISRSSVAQASKGTSVSKSNLQAGDIIIFNNKSNSAIGHVGIYIGGNSFIHAGSPSTGVIITSLSDSYYSSRYVTARRIIN